jgi:oxygen-dependent protoporphyrinogen oxidase
MPSVAPHVVIIGGGITGLAAAYSLEQRAPSAVPVRSTLIEAAPRLGGKILTEHVDGFVIEGGPESFLAHKPWGLDLCRRLGLSKHLMGTNPAHQKTFVLLRGRLCELPEGLVLGLPTKLVPFLRSRLLSWAGKLRVAAEFVLPPGRKQDDESLASFFRRRLGDEAFERIVEPLLSGIYTGDANELSLLATFPQFREMEQSGGLLRAMLSRKNKRQTQPTGYGAWTPFVTLREGLELLVQTLASQLQHTAVMKSTVQVLRRRDNAYELVLGDGSMIKADAVILSTPAFVAASLLDPLDPALSKILRGIPYTSTATVSLGFQHAHVRHDLNGYGFVVPRVEQRPLLACTWTSSKWDQRAPQGTVLIRCYFGGAGREAVLERTDDELVELARHELAAILHIQHEPLVSRVYRWPRAMPQYQVGHLKRLAEIVRHLEQAPGIILAGAAYRGVGLPDCIRDGQTAAEAVLRYFDKQQAPSV